MAVLGRPVLEVHHLEGGAEAGRLALTDVEPAPLLVCLDEHRHLTAGPTTPQGLNTLFYSIGSITSHRRF